MSEQPTANPVYLDAAYGLQQSEQATGTRQTAGPGAQAGPPSARPLKAILVGPCLVRGGAEQWLLYLARFLDRRRIELVRTVVTNRHYIDPDFRAEVPIPVELGQASAIQRAARQCDILLCWGLRMDQYLNGVRPKLCVFIAHGDGDWTRMLLQHSAGSVDHVVAVSRRVRDRVCNGFSTSVIYNGVDTARLGHTRSRQSMRQLLGFQPGDFVLGFVGRFSGEKQVRLIIEAAARLPAHFKVLLVGWGQERRPLMEAANALVPGRYVFAEATEYLGDYYRAMDAFCLVSNQEGFSMALLEAMMCERPLIVTSVGSVPELIQDRINGIVVPDQSDSIARAARLLQEHPDWARGVAAEGKAIAERYGHARNMARGYEALLERLWRNKYLAS